MRYPFFGVSSTISGVGYNVARALAGCEVAALCNIETRIMGEPANTR